jgi:hypothetical protein
VFGSPCMFHCLWITPHGPHVRLSSGSQRRCVLSVCNNFALMRKSAAADSNTRLFRTKPSQRSGAARTPSTKASSSSTAAKFDRFGRKMKWCSLCNCSSDADSPLSNSKPDDRYSGCRPWNRVSSRQIMDVERGLLMIEDPEGYYCGLCPGLFRMIGSIDGEFQTNSISSFALDHF